MNVLCTLSTTALPKPLSMLEFIFNSRQFSSLALSPPKLMLLTVNCMSFQGHAMQCTSDELTA